MENQTELATYINEAIGNIQKTYQGELTIENILYQTQEILNNIPDEKTKQKNWNTLMELQKMVGDSQN